jgi:hypothetical protein
LLLLFFALPAFAADPAPIADKAPQIAVQKIWDAGPHNAFTDLIRFQDRWWCTFREATAHVGGNGKSRVLQSPDGKEWKSAALVEEDGIDLRDPKLSITPDGRLMMIMGGSIYEGKTFKGRQPRVSFSSDGRTWSAPKKVLEPDEWLWRVTWHDGVCYGVSYNAAARSEPAAKDAAATGKVPPGPAEWKLKLVSSKDGETFETITHLDVPGHPNESTIRFLPDGRMAALIRREGGDQQGWIGTSKAPYKEWTYHPVGQRVGGPNFVVLPDGRLIASTRKYKPTVQTILAALDADTGKLTELLALPSGGDTSYAGLVVHDGKLWVSYYSSHEKKSSIYATSLPLEKLKATKE